MIRSNLREMMWDSNHHNTERRVHDRSDIRKQGRHDEKFNSLMSWGNHAIPASWVSVGPRNALVSVQDSARLLINPLLLFSRTWSNVLRRKHSSGVGHFNAVVCGTSLHLLFMYLSHLSLLSYSGIQCSESILYPTHSIFMVLLDEPVHVLPLNC
ncbi:hypothetical protein BDV32DRAFT_70467 [Aspergillus pseudonomiae]|nr:hypothetical protein BDV32DRAFT_70467 [Aspergillus pseudonomiae]